MFDSILATTTPRPRTRFYWIWDLRATLTTIPSGTTAGLSSGSRHGATEPLCIHLLRRQPGAGPGPYSISNTGRAIGGAEDGAGAMLAVAPAAAVDGSRGRRGVGGVEAADSDRPRYRVGGSAANQGRGRCRGGGDTALALAVAAAAAFDESWRRGAWMGGEHTVPSAAIQLPQQGLIPSQEDPRTMERFPPGGLERGAATVAASFTSGQQEHPNVLSSWPRASLLKERDRATPTVRRSKSNTRPPTGKFAILAMEEDIARIVVGKGMAGGDAKLPAGPVALLGDAANVDGSVCRAARKHMNGGRSSRRSRCWPRSGVSWSMGN